LDKWWRLVVIGSDVRTVGPPASTLFMFLQPARITEGTISLLKDEFSLITAEMIMAGQCLQLLARIVQVQTGDSVVWRQFILSTFISLSPSEVVGMYFRIIGVSQL
jgi:hypothetical protein